MLQQAAAAPQEALDIPEISPRYAYIRDTEADLEITGGLANCSASVSAPTSSYDVELTVELQQNRSGWVRSRPGLTLAPDMHLQAGTGMLLPDTTIV